MRYSGILKTEYIENKIKSLPEKLKKIFEYLVGVIIGIILAIVGVAVFFGLTNWFLKEILGVI